MASNTLNASTLITLIVPVYEAAAHIRACLISVLDQLPEDCELIIVDDGSPDESMKIARDLLAEYRGTNDRLRCIVQDNQGLSGARNTGVDAAHGRYIGFLDADDLLHGNYFERLRSVLCNEPLASIVCFNAERLIESDDGISYREHLTVHPGEAVFDPQTQAGYELLANSFARGWWFAWARLYDRRLFKSHRFTLGFKYQDMLLLPELYRRAERIVNIDDVLVSYRVHQTSITARPNQSTFDNLDDIIAHYSRPSPTLAPRLDALRHLVLLNAVESVFHARRRTHGTRSARDAMRKRQRDLGIPWLAQVLLRHGHRMSSRTILLHLSPLAFHGAGRFRRKLRCALDL